MQTTDLVRLYTQRLQDAGIKYMITGSVACIVYGEPRLTHDVDLVVELSLPQIKALQKAFPSDEFYVPPEEILTIDVQRAQRASFNIIHHATGFKADIYLVGRDSFQQWGLANTKTIQIGSETLSLAPPEYVIVRKLEYFREGGSEKHIRDIDGVLRKLPELKSAQTLLARIEALGLQAEWKAVVNYRRT